MKKATVTLFVFLFFMDTALTAQNLTGYSSWEEVIEQLSSDEDENINWENEIEELYEHLSEPVNLNGITKEELEQFPFLTDIQIENVLAYLYIHGEMQTVYELQLVEEMDRQTIQYLIPFVCVRPLKKKEQLPSLPEILHYGKNELVTRFDIPFYEREGYKDSYLGTPQYHSLRYSFRYRENLYWGLTAEKDAGEPFLALHDKQGYDYYSFYFLLRNYRKLKTLAIGNYRLSFGQGLVISSDYTMGKTVSSATIGTRKSGIKKHSSTDEYNYFQGVASAVKTGDFTLSAFYSHRSLDGIVTDSTITSIQKTGLHRTEREAKRKEAFSLQLAGTNISFSKNQLKVGMTGIYYFFDRPYQPQVREYSNYNLRGTEFYNIGMDYNYRLRRFLFSGETAMSKNGGSATLNSLQYSSANGYRVTVLHRYYTYDYWAMLARSFSEGGYVQNENGLYAAIEGRPMSYWQLFASVDFFAFPWLKYGIDKPSSGFDALMQLSYSPRNRLAMTLRYRYKKKEKNYTEGKEKDVRPLHRHQVRYRFTYTPTDYLALRTTIDYTQVYPQHVSASQGFQLTQTVSCAFQSVPVKLEVQGTYFHTDDYESRVYLPEKGMMYSFYIPSFYGEGSRIMAHVRYDFHRNGMIIAKLGQTTYYDRDKIGSGTDVIPNNKKLDLQMQVKITF
ncbi:hypothetical protein EZS27_011301 [termite gut metagenome]|uniref:Helix-hairpin-helix domain-containing protein n=1 Tax=termite gut metagenome TaxID=433724 RepID=A0A5J4S667_9ZZZZ